MARTRKTSRRKGRRTGAIEVPQALFDRIWKAVKAEFEPVGKDSSYAPPKGSHDALYAAVFGWRDTWVLLPRNEMRMGGIVIPVDEPRWWRHAGHHTVPSARYGGKRLSLRVIIADPLRSRFYRSRSKRVAGHIEYAGDDVVETTKKQQREFFRAASEKLGIPLHALNTARDEYGRPLCEYTYKLGLTIVLFVPFETIVGGVALSKIRDTLWHELAHAMDEEVRRPWVQHVSKLAQGDCEEEIRQHFDLPSLHKRTLVAPGNLEEEPAEPTKETLAGYYNLPYEVSARLAQIWGRFRRLDTQKALASELKKHARKPMGTVLFNWAFEFPPFREMWEHLGTKNRQRVMRALADMAAPTIEAEADRRGHAVPGPRRTSRGRPISPRRTSRNARPRGPRRTPVQRTLISELWGLVHRQLFLKAQGRPYEHLDKRIAETEERLKRQGVAPGDVEWECIQARQSGAHFEDIVK